MTGDANHSKIGERRSKALEAGNEDYIERRERVIAAAAKMFAERGYQRTSFNDIANQLQIDRASLYYYVGNKSDLFEAVAMTPIEYNIQALAEVTASDISPDKKLRLVIEQLMTSFEDNFPKLYIFIREDLRKLDVDAVRSKKAADLQRRYYDLFIDVVREGQASGVLRDELTPAVIAYSIVGMLAWSHNWFRPDGPMTGRELGEALATIVLDGIREPSST